MLKKIKIYISSVAGLAFTLANKYHTKVNLRTLQSPIIAHRMIITNTYHAIQAFSCHTSVNYPPKKRYFIHL